MLDPERIKSKREALKLTQREAAERAGLAQPAWARIESGARTDPNLSTAVRLAHALKCKIEQLLRSDR